MLKNCSERGSKEIRWQGKQEKTERTETRETGDPEGASHMVGKENPPDQGHPGNISCDLMCISLAKEHSTTYVYHWGWN